MLSHFSHVRIFVTLWTVALQAPLSIEFSRQEYWSGLLFLSSHEIKRRLLLGRQVMTNLDSILKSRDITLSTKVRLVEAMVFSVIRYGCETIVWTIKKAECQRIDGFELWCWRRLLRVPWTARRSNQSILILGVHLKDWYWSWNSNILATWCEEMTHLKRPWCWERLRAEREGDDRGWDGWMASPTQWTWVWTTPGVGDGQGSLACCGSGKPGMLWFMGSQRVGHNWETELNHLWLSAHVFLNVYGGDQQYNSF